MYAIDILIGLAWLQARKLRVSSSSPLGGVVLFIAGTAVVSEIASGIRSGHLLEPLYMAVRTVLAASLFFLVQRCVRTSYDLEILLKAALPGVVLTAVLLITTSLPQTRDIVLRYVFSHTFLEPSSEGVIRGLEMFGERGARGRSLVGVSILSGAFINTMWPLLLLLHRKASLGYRWRLLLTSTLILVPVAVVMTYSRGAILGLLLVVLTSLFFARNVRRPIVLGVGIAALIFLAVGLDAPYFYFDRLTLTTQDALRQPFSNRSLDERLFAYIEPFRHLVKHPSYLFVGDGLIRWRNWIYAVSIGYNPPDHAVFSAAYFSYGMLAAFAYVILLVRGLRTTWKAARGSRRDFATQYAQALFAGMSGFLSWYLLGHAAVSQPRGAMLLFLVFGMVASLSNFAPAKRASDKVRSAVLWRPSLGVRMHRQ